MQVFLFQKSAIHKCNMVGKPAIITRVVDTMTENLRPTRAEATDVANAVLDGLLSVSCLTYFQLALSFQTITLFPFSLQGLMVFY